MNVEIVTATIQANPKPNGNADQNCILFDSAASPDTDAAIPTNIAIPPIQAQTRPMIINFVTDNFIMISFFKVQRIP